MHSIVTGILLDARPIKNPAGIPMQKLSGIQITTFTKHVGRSDIDMHRNIRQIDIVQIKIMITSNIIIFIGQNSPIWLIVTVTL